jgi:hypothetical protein
MKNAVAGVGLAPDAAMVTFPINMFLPGSDIESLKERRQEIYEGLIAWKSELARAAGPSRMLEVEAATYEQALTKANNVLLANLWGDGLPLWPATKERVDWILRGATVPRTHVLGKFPPRGGVTTVETCAIALAMAGGRPEYLPVLIAAVDACLSAQGFDQLQATSGGPFPAVIVNGPIAKQIRLNSGFGLLGPDPQHPAGASIGRALRLLQQNVGGALAGRRHDGDLRRHALHQRRIRRGRGQPAPRLAAACDPAPRLRAGHELGLGGLRERGHERPAPRREERNPGRRRVERHVAHGGLHAHAQPRPLGVGEGHARHHDDRAHRRAAHGGDRLDPAIDPRVPVGKFENPDGADAARRRARRG